MTAHSCPPASRSPRARHTPLSPVVLRLRTRLAARDAEIAVLTRQLDDLLDRESMRAGAACMECLTTAAALDRYGMPRARHHLDSHADTAASTRPCEAGSFLSPASQGTAPAVKPFARQRVQAPRTTHPVPAEALPWTGRVRVWCGVRAPLVPTTAGRGRTAPALAARRHRLALMLFASLRRVLVTRLADCSRVRGRWSVRIGETSAPVRAATRIPMHHRRAVLCRVVALAVVDAVSWLRAFLVVVVTPAQVRSAGKCDAPPAMSPPHRRGRR